MDKNIGYLIRFNYSLDDLKRTIECITESAKYITVINDRPEYADEIWKILKSLPENTKYTLSSLLKEHTNNDLSDQLFEHIPNGIFCMINCGEKIVPQKFIDGRFTICISDDKSQFATLSYIYRQLCGNRKIMIPDGTVDNRTFYDRVSDLNIEGAIISWEKLFNG